MNEKASGKQVEVEQIVEMLLKSGVEDLDELLSPDGVLKQALGRTLETMLEGEKSEHLGYEPYEAKGRNSGNSRNGSYSKKLQTSNGEIDINAPRDRKGEFEPQVVRKYETSSNELEDKVIAMYAKGMTQRDIEKMLRDLYGAKVSASLISNITDKVLPLVEEWQNRPLESVYPVVLLDALHLNGRTEKCRQRPFTSSWASPLKANGMFWDIGPVRAAKALISGCVLNDIHARGVEDIFIACIDGLKGFAEAIETVFPKTRLQRCIIHQIRCTLKYVSHNDRKAFTTDLKAIYKASTREAAEMALEKLAEKWGKKYPVSVRSWQDNWDDLATFFDFGPHIRRLIYTTNSVEAYHRQLRKMSKNRGIFPSAEAARKLLYLAHRDIEVKWSKSIFNWTAILNELAIHFKERLPL